MNNSNTEANRFSNKLIWTNFILAVSVVILHVINISPVIDTNLIWVDAILNMLSNLANIAVPCFFAISGFLFYYNFEWNQLIGKWKRRIFSLLIPFVIWNSIIFIFYAVISRIQVFEMEPTLLSIKNYILSVVNSVNSPLWFIRTLVVYVILSPILVFFWKRKWVAMGMIIVLIASNYIGVSTSIVSNYYLPMYLLGVYMALYHPAIIDNYRVVGGGKKYFALLGMIGVLVIAALYEPFDLGNNWLYTLRFLGALSFWFVLDFFKFDKKPAGWVKNSFTIYLIHFMLVKLLKLLTYYYLPHSLLIIVVEVIFYPIIVVAIIIWLSELLKKNKVTAPVWKIMIGNR